MKKKLFSILALLCMAVTGAWAEELTVYDGTGTINYVPFYGFYGDAYLKCEFVMPAADLSEMAGAEINAMTFYASSPAEAAWTSNVQVFMKEVAETTISSFYGTADATIVYEGTLDGTQSSMTVNFTTPYTYGGGNLLIGFYNTTAGIYKSVTWAGETVTGASVQGYSYSSIDAITATQRNFLPKTTFTYGSAAVSSFDLTVGENEHGTIVFTNADGEEISTAAESQVVTVTVTPDDEHEAAGVTGQWYAAIAASRGRVASQGSDIDLLTDIEFTPVEGTDNQWTFTMQRANAEISASYWDLKDIIELLRQETDLAGAVFKAYHDKMDNETLKGMFIAIGQSCNLLRVYDKGVEVSLEEAYELYKTLKGYNAMFADDITTGIKNVNENENGNENGNRWYDLNGRRVAQPTKGIYILNGRKVVIK